MSLFLALVLEKCVTCCEQSILCTLSTVQNFKPYCLDIFINYTNHWHFGFHISLFLLIHHMSERHDTKAVAFIPLAVLTAMYTSSKLTNVTSLDDFTSFSSTENWRKKLRSWFDWHLPNKANNKKVYSNQKDSASKLIGF